MPKAPAENPVVKKTMTKLKSCTKKYRKAVRAYYKASATLGKYKGTDSKRRTTLHKKSEKANEKADKIQQECTNNTAILGYFMRAKQVVKEDNNVKIQKLIQDFEKDEQDWSSNTSSDKEAMQ
jgi:hypothetical protein